MTDTDTSTVTFKIAGMSCAACQIHVQRALESVPGVTAASVNLMAHTAQVTSTAPLDPAAVITAVHNSGYEATLPALKGTGFSPSVEAAKQGGAGSSGLQPRVATEGDGHLGLRALLALIAGAVTMLLSMPSTMTTTLGIPLSAQPLARWVSFTLALATMLFAAPEIYTAAWRAALHRATNMNTLVAIGTLAAFLSSFAATIAPNDFKEKGMTSTVYFDSVILILAFLLTGRWLEARARRRATAALRGFAELESADARLLTVPPNWVPQVPHLEPGSDANSIDYNALPETLLPLSAIEPNDIIRVLPGDRIPHHRLDHHRRTSVDESMLTGEPLPVTRAPGDRVSGGTLNLDGPLVLRATAVGAASTLAQMQRLLEQAQSSRAPMQRLADRASAIFVPTVLALAALTFAVWAVLGNTAGHHDGLARALSVAIAVLIIACPCAMGLAVPAAVTVSLGRAAQLGLLIKGGEALERLATVDTIALDKTGTLTLGKPIIAQFNTNPGAPGPASGTWDASGTSDASGTGDASGTSDGPATTPTFSRETLLACAAAAERLSTHPLAQAVVTYYENSVISTEVPHLNSVISTEAQRRGETRSSTPQPQISDLTILPGTGLTCTVTLPTGPHKLTLGNATLIPDPSSLIPALPNATPLYLLLDDRLEAVFYATDELRPNARAVITDLRTLGIQPILLTGDIAASAEPIAHAAGIDRFRAHLLPAGKLEAIRALQQQGHRVAMAGDGINDAAALAQSDAGLAMPAASELAREAGDILLLHADLALLPLAVRIARRTVRIMRQNLGWAAVYNLIGIPIAAGALYPHFHILLSPVLASAAMALSSVSVLANSLRLRRL